MPSTKANFWFTQNTEVSERYDAAFISFHMKSVLSRKAVDSPVRQTFINKMLPDLEPDSDHDTDSDDDSEDSEDDDLKYAENNASSSPLKQAAIDAILAPIVQRLGLHYAYHSEDRRCYANESNWLSVNTENRGYITLILDTCSLEHVEYLQSLHEFFPVEEEDEAGNLYALGFHPTRGFQLVQLDTIGTELDEKNYTPKVCAQQKAMIEDLKSDAPMGRLFILSGPPGTGKTYLIRNIVKEVNAVFILVPPTLIPELGSPQMLPSLLAMRNEYEGSLVFILEDSDSMLVPRIGSNMNSIAALLNLCDGMMGSALDIRVIASTNAEKTEFDPALIRPGRLSEHLVLDKLDNASCVAWLKNIGMEKLFNQLNPEGNSLAELFLMAKKAGWSPE